MNNYLFTQLLNFDMKGFIVGGSSITEKTNLLINTLLTNMSTKRKKSETDLTNKLK